MQVIDDILDYEVSSQEFGKSSTQDLQNGNLTAPFLFALQEDSTLSDFYDNGFSQLRDIEKVFTIITTKTSALQKSKALAKELQDKALAELDIIQSYLKLSFEELERLKDLTRAISNRRR